MKNFDITTGCQNPKNTSNKYHPDRLKTYSPTLLLIHPTQSSLLQSQVIPVQLMTIRRMNGRIRQTACNVCNTQRTWQVQSGPFKENYADEIPIVRTDTFYSVLYVTMKPKIFFTATHLKIAVQVNYAFVIKMSILSSENSRKETRNVNGFKKNTFPNTDQFRTIYNTIILT